MSVHVQGKGNEPENAIQRAHTDNHCAKAVEMMLWDATTDRASRDYAREECLPAAPTMQDVREHNTRASRRPAAPQAAEETNRLTEAHGEATEMVGKRLRMPSGGDALQDIRKAVGFFLYVTLPGNSNSSWPETLGT